MSKKEFIYKKVDSYTMQVRIYPNKEQREFIDRYFIALEKAANMTLWGLKEHDPMITQELPDKNNQGQTVLWPNWYEMAKASTWMKFLREENPLIAELPGSALSSSIGGLFAWNMKKAWEKQGKLPVDTWFEAKNEKGKPLVHWYGKTKRITSIFMQIRAGAFTKDGKRIFVKIPKLGEARIRGWNEKIMFGENANKTFFEGIDKKKALGCRISRNNIGEYYLTITLQNAMRPFRVADYEEEIGINVGLGKDNGVISTYAVSRGLEHYENKTFKRDVEELDQLYHKQLSRRYGISNAEYRDDLREARRENKKLMNEGKEERVPLPEPSRRYQKTDKKQKKLNIKVKRKRELYQHEISAREVSHASFLAKRSMNVKGMMKNDNIAYSASDAALSQQLSMLNYKAAWKGIEIGKAGDVDKTVCPDCLEPTTADWKTEWTCSKCGKTFGPYEAFAKGVLNKAKYNHEHGIDPDKERKEKKKQKGKPENMPVGKDAPDAFIHFSEEMKADFKNPWIIVSAAGAILDDAQGYGYTTRQSAKKAYRHRIKGVAKA